MWWLYFHKLAYNFWCEEFLFSKKYMLVTTSPSPSHPSINSFARNFETNQLKTKTKLRKDKTRLYRSKSQISNYLLPKNTRIMCILNTNRKIVKQIQHIIEQKLLLLAFISTLYLYCKVVNPLAFIKTHKYSGTLFLLIYKKDTIFYFLIIR